MASRPNIQKHRIKSKVVVYAGLIILGIGAIYLLVSNTYQPRESSALYFQDQVNTPSPNTTLPSSKPTTTPIQEAKTLTDISWFYPGLSWQAQPAVAPGELSWAVTYGGQRVLLHWQTWTAKKTGLSVQDSINFELQFHKYYETALAVAGWENSPGVIINGKRLLSNEAAGAGGTEWSYLGVKEGSFRVILLQQKYDGMYRESPPVGSIDEPRGESYTVFLSDITPIVQLSSLLQ